MNATRERILDLLRSGPCTVLDLAERVGTTLNAVRAHLAVLQHEGLVAIEGLAQAKRKPRQLFALTPAGERRFSRVHEPLLKRLVDVMVKRLSSDTATELFEQAGRELVAPFAAKLESMNAAERAAFALQVVAELGGRAQVVRTEGRTLVRGAGCPLGEVVREQPLVCRVLRSALAAMLDQPVRVCCEHSPRPRCCFEIGSGD